MDNRLILKLRKFCCCNSQIILNTKNKCDVRCGLKILWAKFGENSTRFVQGEQFSSKSNFSADRRHGDTIILCKPEEICTVQKQILGQFVTMLKQTSKKIICVHMTIMKIHLFLFSVDSWLWKVSITFVPCPTSNVHGLSSQM